MPVQSTAESSLVASEVDVGDSAPVQLPSPHELRESLPVSSGAAASIARGRETLRAILAGRDPRLAIITGPCSLHDREGALEYARRLSSLGRRLEHSVVVVMRCYVEKPRTRLGWKGIVNDPHLDDSCDIAAGLRMTREIFDEVAAMGLPIASEILDPLAVRYYEDLLSWGAIGARTAESQPHRELASSLPFPMGIKNAMHGGIEEAIDAITAARSSHSVLTLGDDGRARVVRTPGNADAHLVLRGGHSGPNCDFDSVSRAASVLQGGGEKRPIVIDCSHGNSGKDHTRQAAACREVLSHFTHGTDAIAGIALESNLEPGRQPFKAGDSPKSGLSITDACIGWDETESLLCEVAGEVRKALDRRVRRRS